MAIITQDAGFSGLRGKTANTVYAQTKYGIVVRSKPIRLKPSTPAMVEQQQRFTQAVAAYRTLTPTEHAAWKQFALSPLNLNPETGKPNGITAYNAFIALATRFLAVSPDAPLPTLPPEYPFSGDPIALTFAGETGQIVVQASGANSDDVVTELFLCPLKFPSQSVRLQDYKSAGWVTFTSEQLTATLERPAGWYAVASRFVSKSSGLVTYRIQAQPVQVD